jgi:hypothetical protein
MAVSVMPLFTLESSRGYVFVRKSYATRGGDSLLGLDSYRGPCDIAAATVTDLQVVNPHRATFRR